MKEHFGQEGVSEIVGVMLLLGLTIIGVALVGIVFLSDSQPDEIPHATIAAGNESGSLALVHEGGDPLREGDYRIYVDTRSGLVDRTNNFTGLEVGEPWSIGRTLVYNGTGTPARVVITVGSGGSETIFSEPEFVGGATAFSPDPAPPGVTPVVTPIPVPTLEEIIISPGIGTSLEIGHPGNDKFFDFAAVIRRNDTVRVDLIIYNYGETRSNENKINKINAYEMTEDETLDFYYNKTVKITGDIGDVNDQVSITIIAYNATSVTTSESILATILQRSDE